MPQSSGEVIAITAVFTFFELCSVGLRLWARRITGPKGGGIGIDDILAFSAAVCDSSNTARRRAANILQFLFVVGLAVPLIIREADET